VLLVGGDASGEGLEEGAVVDASLVGVDGGHAIVAESGSSASYR
jgi:hypothetical protein